MGSVSNCVFIVVDMFLLFPVVLSHPFLIALLPKYVMTLPYLKPSDRLAFYDGRFSEHRYKLILSNRAVTDHK